MSEKKGRRHPVDSPVCFTHIWWGGWHLAANQQPCRAGKSALQKQRRCATQQHVSTTKRPKTNENKCAVHVHTHNHTLRLVLSPTCTGFSSSKSTFKASGKTFCVAAAEYRSNLEGCKWLHCEGLKGSEEGAGEGDGDECRERRRGRRGGEGEGRAG